MNEKDFMINEETLEKYLGNDEVVSIPESVTEIGCDAFKFNHNTKKVIFHKNVTVIGKDAFFACKSLTDIIIPPDTKLERIGIGAFSCCFKLHRLDFSANTYIDFTSFTECKSMADKDGFVIYEGKPTDELNGYKSETISGILYGYYGTKTKAIVPDNVKHIVSCAFYKNKAVKEIVLPQHLEYIYSHAFSHCSKLETITIPENIKLIEKGVFSYCKSLRSITIPKSIRKFDVYAQFEGDTSLQKVELPKINTIGDLMFYGCESLSEFIIPDTVKEISYDAFKGCSSLTTIRIPKNIKKISECAFEGCTSLVNVYLPDSICKIENRAFYGCISLKTINLPKGLIDVGKDAFFGCSNIEDAELEKTINFSNRVIQSPTTKYLTMSYKIKPTNNFVDFYSQFYFDNNIYSRIKDIIGIPSDLGTINEEAETWIYNNCLKKGVFDSFALAWKSGKVLWQNNKICFKKSFISDESYRNGLNYPIYIPAFKKFCKSINNISQSDWETETFEKLYSSIVSDSPKNIGPVYICTSIFFKTKGRYPIYDQFAHKAIRALICNMSPDDIYIGSNPDKSEINKVDKMYNEYIKLLEKLKNNEAFSAEYGDLSKHNPEFISRKFDQALWVYGHCKVNWFDIPNKLRSALNDYKYKDLHSQLEELLKAFG